MTFSRYNRQVPLHPFLPKYPHLENEAGRTPLPLHEYQTDKEPKTFELGLDSYLRFLQSAPLIPVENTLLLLLTPTVTRAISTISRTEVSKKINNQKLNLDNNL